MLSENRQPLLGRVRPRHLTANGELYGRPNGTPPVTVCTGLSQALPEAAAWLSLVAYIRHVFTEYDDLLQQGYDEESARHFVAGDIEAVLSRWGSRRRLTPDE